MDCFEHGLRITFANKDCHLKDTQKSLKKDILQAIRPYIHNHDNMLRLDYLTVAKGINTKGMWISLLLS
jgi:hypothetical protein